MLSDETIKNALQDLKLERIRMRDEEVNKQLDYYSSNTNKYTSEYFDGATSKEAPMSNYNFTARFIDKMSRIYQAGVKRNGGAKYSDMILNKDVAMKHQEKMSNLNGTMALLPSLGKDIVFKYQQIYKFVPFFGKDALNPIAVAYPIMLPVSDPSNTAELGWGYYDDTVYKQFDNDGGVIHESTINHGLGILPVIFTHKDHQLDEFFVEGATDIITANEQVNVTMTELAVGSRYQLWGQPWMTGVDSDKSYSRMGVNNIIALDDPDSKFGIESPGGDLETSVDLVKFMVELVAQNNHLWITWSEQGGEVPSGISLMIRDLERHEDYVDDIKLWRLYEDQIYEVEKALAKARGVTLDEKLGLDFIPPEYPLSTNDQIIWDDHRLRLDLITNAELTLEYNEDLGTIAKANKAWEKRKKINDKNRDKLQLPKVSDPAPKVDNRIDQ